MFTNPGCRAAARWQKEKIARRRAVVLQLLVVVRDNLSRTTVYLGPLGEAPKDYLFGDREVLRRYGVKFV